MKTYLRKAVLVFSFLVLPMMAWGDNGNVDVYVTKTGTKYHRADCRSLRQSKIAMKLKDAAKKYSPCKICKPPILEK